MEIYDGVTVTQNGHYSSLLENGWQNGNQNTSGKNSVLTIHGGAFYGGLNTIKNDDYGELEIKGGTFTNVSQAAFLNWNVATVSGGTFSPAAGASAVILNGRIDETMDQGKLTITGGTFQGSEEIDAIQSMSVSGSKSIGTLDISGGDFTGDINLLSYGTGEAEGT